MQRKTKSKPETEEDAESAEGMLARRAGDGDLSRICRVLGCGDLRHCLFTTESQRHRENLKMGNWVVRAPRLPGGRARRLGRARRSIPGKDQPPRKLPERGRRSGKRNQNRRPRRTQRALRGCWRGALETVICRGSAECWDAVTCGIACSPQSRRDTERSKDRQLRRT